MRLKKRMNFLEEITAVPWDELYHHYGNAADVPEMLYGLLSTKSQLRQEARRKLVQSLNHQGLKRWEATLRVIPFLLRLLNDPFVYERHLLIPILADFAVGNSIGYYHFYGFDLDDVYSGFGSKEFGQFVFQDKRGRPEDLTYGQLMRVLYTAVQQGLPLYLGLLHDKSKILRIFAPYILAWLTDSADTSIPALMTQFQGEENAIARSSQVLAMSYASTFNTAQQAKCLPIWQEALSLARSWLEKRALGIALLRAGHCTKKNANMLLVQLREARQASFHFKGFPWQYLNSSYALARLLFIHAPEWKREISFALCESIRTCSNEHEVLNDACLLLEENFLKPDANLDFVRLEDLTSLQEHILRCFAQTPLVWYFSSMQEKLNDYGLAINAETLEKFLVGHRDSSKPQNKSR
jgi:hypothetical protein